MTGITILNLKETKSCWLSFSAKEFINLH